MVRFFLTGVLIAFIMSIYLPKLYCERFTAALSMNVTSRGSVFYKFLFSPFVLKLTVAGFIYVTGFSSAVGSASCGDSSHDA